MSQEVPQNNSGVVVEEEGIIPSTETIGRRLLGPNYKVRLSGYAKAFNDVFLYLALAPYALGAAGIILPSWLKAPIFFVCAAAKFFITIRQSNQTKQADAPVNQSALQEAVQASVLKVMAEFNSGKKP
jgi:hypothetical protein